MSTDPTRNSGPGILAPKLSEIPSDGLNLNHQSVGVQLVVWQLLRNNSNGVRLNWIAISVCRFARRLPVRK